MNLRLTDSKIMNDINVAGVKVCKKCDTQHPATSTYFYRAEANKDGLRCECKRCTDNAQNQKKLKDYKNVDVIKKIESQERELKKLKTFNVELLEQKTKTTNKNARTIKANVFLATGLIVSIFSIVAVLCYK